MRNTIKHKFILAAIFLLWLFLCDKAFAQPGPYVFRHLTTGNGLINTRISNLYQDKKGYIWIGTIDGLQRYDGSRFVNYLPDLHDPEALHNGWITNIFEDSKHRFWIGTNAGAPYLLDRGTGKFYNYSLHVEKETPIINGVSKFLEDNSGDIWLINRYGYYKLNNHTNQFESCNGLLGITAGMSPESLDKDNKGNIWVATTGGIKCYNPLTEKITDRDHNPGQLKVFEAEPDFTAFLVSGDKCWIGVRRRKMLLKYDLVTNTISKYSFKNANGTESNSLDIELNTANLSGYADRSVIVDLIGEGIAIYDPVKDSFTKIPVKNDDPNGLHGNLESFWGIISLKDRDGNIWVTSDDMDLNIFNPGKTHFYFYRSNITFNQKNTTEYEVNGFLQDPLDNDIYICYYDRSGGIVRFSSDLTLKKKYLFSKAGNTHINENQLWCLFQDEQGIIWAPNQAKTMLKLDARKDQLTLVNDTALFGNINTIERDEKGDIWFGYWSGGLKKIDHQTHQVISFTAATPGVKMLPRNIFTIYFDADSIIWAGTNGQGFYQFDKRSNRYTNHFLFDENDPSSISSNIIKRIIPYNDDTLLLATGMGIDIFDKKKKIFSCLTTKDGLPGNIVETIALDDLKNVWAACDGGFCKININNFSITKYGISDGITDNIFSNAPFLKLKDGKFLVSANKGFMAFKPEDILDTPPVTPVITGFKIFDKPIRIDSLTDAASIHLAYKDNSIVIEFASLQYNFSDETKFYYQMGGIDPDWILSGKEQAAHYNQMQSGKYIFKIKSVNRDGLASSRIAELNIVITPPFWKTWWFRLVGVLIVAGILYGIIQRRINHIKTREAVRQQIAELEIKALKARMNPHFIFNAMNSIQQFTLMGEIDKANKYISTFSRLLRKVLHQSEQNIISLTDEIDMLKLYLEIEAVRLGDDFSYQVNLGNEKEAQLVKVPNMLLQPFVENALHHGLVHKEGNKFLQINIKMPDDDTVICEIIDNGIGRKKAGELKNNLHPSLQYKSVGMRMVEERLHLLSGSGDKPITIFIKDIISDAGQPGGTCVTITIPQP